MAYNSPESPRLQNIPLRPPFRSDASQASLSVSPTNTTASRFHAALESMPSRHAYHHSISSETSDDGPGTALDAARDSYLPNGNRMFDALQRELSLKEGLAALASPSESQDFDMRPLVTPTTATTTNDGGDQLGTLRGLPRSRREYLNGSRMLRGSSQDNLVTLGDPGDGSRSSEGADSGGSTIPLVPSGDSLNELSSSTDGVRSRERRAGERVFPAPLLLRSDRSYSPSSSGGGAPAPTSATAYLPSTAPLAFQRRPSGSNVGGDAAGQSRDWTRRDASNGGTAGLSISTRSALPYQNHRQQQSSTSSVSYGSSLPYSTSPSYESRIQSSAIGLNISTSPTSYTRNVFTSITPPTSTLPTPSTTSSALPPLGPAALPLPSASTSEGSISAQALLLHIHSLRSASSPMTLTRSLGPPPPPRANGIQLADPADHQRGRSTEAGTSAADPDALSASMSAAGPPPERTLSQSSSSHALAKLDTVDLSHKRIAEVPVEVVDELKNEVEKLALGYNLLRDLSPHFAGLGNRLKYLNIRVNLLTTFPAVVRLFWSSRPPVCSSC